ncbi:hypothetical protein [Mastigocoleus sp. MO_188.B34]|uniref:hypothetical protein n=1 Tax=Mastigocoleus sp. MO_188.B34 TaxID=3036635 RepID=UPI00262D13C1|nr:hypothetical protein [Mastigocoleus sp. MO_188.B34]MDJ0695369.1 hypothetical protein [Mastigocoleus sp. MO_188.B34]
MDWSEEEKNILDKLPITKRRELEAYLEGIKYPPKRLDTGGIAFSNGEQKSRDQPPTGFGRYQPEVEELIKKRKYPRD